MISSPGRLDELLRFEAELLEGFSQLTQDIGERIGPIKDASSVDDGGGLVQLEVGSEEFDVYLTSPAELLVAGANSVDVLLRHRPPSISPDAAAFHAKRLVLLVQSSGRYSDSPTASRLASAQRG